jgi:hypothetical protein
MLRGYNRFKEKRQFFPIPQGPFPSSTVGDKACCLKDRTRSFRGIYHAYHVIGFFHVGGVDNIRMDVVEVGRAGVDSIGLAQDRDRWRALVNSVLNLRVP